MMPDKISIPIWSDLILDHFHPPRNLISISIPIWSDLI